MRLSIMLALTFAIAISTSAFGKTGSESTDSSTIVSNGGDALLTRLNSAKAIMKMVFAEWDLRQKFPTPSLYGCLSGTSKADQLCKEFLREAFGQITQFEGSHNPTLLLKKASLFVVDPATGHPTYVAARTSLDKNGPIEFSYDSIKDMEMSELLFLLTHEFMHKVKFRGKFVADNDLFFDDWTGRNLIDKLALEVVSYAKDRGLLGNPEDLKYHFSCSMSSSVFQTETSFLLNRSIHGDSKWRYYKISFGHSKTDPHMYMTLDERSRIEFKFYISNVSVNSCQADDTGSIQMQIVKRTSKPDGTYTYETLKNKILIGKPLCSDGISKFELSHEDKHFACSYTGTTREN